MHIFFRCKQYGKTAVINLQGSIKLKIKEGMQSVEIFTHSLKMSISISLNQRCKTLETMGNKLEGWISHYMENPINGQRLLFQQKLSSGVNMGSNVKVDECQITLCLLNYINFYLEN